VMQATRLPTRGQPKATCGLPLTRVMLPLLAISLSATLLLAALQWTPASYRGLTLGRAHRADVARVLGPPSSVTRTARGEELKYSAHGEHNGDLTIRLDRSGAVVEIEEELSPNLPRTTLYREFGKNPVTANFSQAACAEYALYRDPRGQIELTMYPERGIVLWPNRQGYDFAAIYYMAHAPGVPRPACAPH